MQKKGIIFRLLLMLAAILPLVFLCQGLPKQKSLEADAYASVEDSLTGKQDLIGTDAEALLRDYPGKTANSPFDPTTEKLMDGYALVPITTNFNQASDRFLLQNQSVSFAANDSLYMWVFVPDDPMRNFYTLSLTLNFSDESKLTWSLDPFELVSMLPSSLTTNVNFGWKLFEFPAAAADNFSESFQSKIASSVLVEYVFEGGSVEVPSPPTRKLSLYHLFKADSASGGVSIVDSLLFSNIKVKPEVRARWNRLYLEDTFTFGRVAEVFDYAYVGSEDLLKTPNSNYTWQFTMNVNGTTLHYSLGDEISFTTEGFYNAKFELIEYRQDNSVVIGMCELSTYVENFSIGEFNTPLLKMSTNSQPHMIVFTLSEGLTLNGNIVVATSKEEVVDVSFEVEGNKIKIFVDPQKEGTDEIVVEVFGHREGKPDKKYASSISVQVVASSQGNGTQIVLWSALGAFILVAVIYLIISFVKERKNSVK